ncbi:hypothetical protein D3C81_1729530 [compost metagenome]
MPQVNNAGNTRMDQMDIPLEAPEAEMPNSEISVAVSKPRPNKKPTKYICQSFPTSLKAERKSQLRGPEIVISSAVP